MDEERTTTVVRLGPAAIKMLARVEKLDGHLLELQLTSSGSVRTYNKLRKLKFIKLAEHPSVRRGAFAAMAVVITELGREALAKFRSSKEPPVG